jgi:large subunit ribosomal protein L5
VSDTATDTPTRVKPRMRQRYDDEIRAALQEQLDLPNVMMVPTLEKIVVNTGVGEALVNRANLDSALGDLTTITGQKAVPTAAKKSIANFKLREGNLIGAKVTLRGDRMWEFLDRLISIALPRVRDFRGVPAKSFDGRGNYTLGIRDHLIFQEIDFNKVDKSKGMNVTFVTTAANDEQALHLLRELGMPFARN